MTFAIQNSAVNQVSDRCFRCYNEQYWYGKNFLYDYIEEKDMHDKKVLEIGCAEAGLLKFYERKGAKCYGLELSDVRFNNALILNKDNNLHLFQANICDPNSYANELKSNYDIIIIRDVIEHIYEKDLALKNIYSILKPGGRLFMSFPPKYCAYAGHQQTVPKLLGKIPFLHLLPNKLYKLYLKVIKCPSSKINYLVDTKRTRISIKHMDRIIKGIGYNIEKKSNWFIRPAYSFRFGLPRIKNPFSGLPYLNEIFCNGILYLLIKPEK